MSKRLTRAQAERLVMLHDAEGDVKKFEAALIKRRGERDSALVLQVATEMGDSGHSCAAHMTLDLRTGEMLITHLKDVIGDALGEFGE